MNKLRFTILLTAAVVVLLFSSRMPVVRGADESLHTNAPIYKGDALILQAEVYAADFGVDLDEALRRLRLQEDIGALKADLTLNEAETFGGLWAEHMPQFRVIVQFTQNGEETILPYIEGGPLTDIVQVRQVEMPFAELEATQQEVSQQLYELGVQFDHDINVQENRVELYVLDLPQLTDNLTTDAVPLPSHVEMIEVAGLSRKTIRIYGGRRLEPVSGLDCTGGFTVKHSDGRKGVTTAGHCANGMSYLGNRNLIFQHEAWNPDMIIPYDVQWHTSAYSVDRFQARFYDGSRYIPVHGEKPRGYQYIGENVCKYGITTRAGCGVITSTNFNGTYVRVHSDLVDLGEPGDSGGPWYSGNIAYGLMTGDIEPGNDAYYMAINYIDYLGLDVLTE